MLIAIRKDIMPKNLMRSVKLVFNHIDGFTLRLSGISLNRFFKSFQIKSWLRDDVIILPQNYNCYSYEEPLVDVNEAFILHVSVVTVIICVCA